MSKKRYMQHFFDIAFVILSCLSKEAGWLSEPGNVSGG